ncbi:PREDICTED: purple acid phosphatase 22-like [Nelumbo nucifera]|uniref:Purple acid phosphatase 22-like n=1 Tax=Nelumbo nucifera TaxID=4432 RepID=A0A1U8Q0G4_NELNU|nr:PREDICTED: purple acid phosphatase 22-like [Nelumbo nucifera]
MEELLYQARVDIVFAGHVHAYERFASHFISFGYEYPTGDWFMQTRVYNNKAEQCGPVQVTIGDGGNREGLALTFKKPSSPLSLFREAGFGHDRLRVYNRTHAHWSWYRNDDTDSTVGDQVWLENLAASSRCGVSVHSRSGDDEL